MDKISIEGHSSTRKAGLGVEEVEVEFINILKESKMTHGTKQVVNKSFLSIMGEEAMSHSKSKRNGKQMHIYV